MPFEQLRALIGKGGDKLLAETVGIDKDTPAGEAIDQQRARLFLREHLPRLRPLPGARELILRLRAEGLRLVVATSAKSVEMNALLDLCGVRPYISAHTSSDDPTKYRDSGELEYWQARDPIERFETFLRARGASEAFFAEVHEEAEALAADTRRRTLALEAPPATKMFEHVYTDPHPDIEEQRAWFLAYEASFGGGQ